MIFFLSRSVSVNIIIVTNHLKDIDCGMAIEEELGSCVLELICCALCIVHCVRQPDPHGTYIKDTLMHAVSRKSFRGPVLCSGGICNLSRR